MVANDAVGSVAIICCSLSTTFAANSWLFSVVVGVVVAVVDVVVNGMLCSVGLPRLIGVNRFSDGV